MLVICMPIAKFEIYIDNLIERLKGSNMADYQLGHKH